MTKQASRGVPSSANSHQQQMGNSHVIGNALAGLSAGVVGTVIGYPLDLLKTRLQVSSKTSIAKTTASILRNEGIRGFFKGLMTPLVSISIISSVTFASYSWLRPRLGAQKGWDIRNAVAAMICAPIMCPITTMEGLVRTQMQVDNIHKKQYHGSWHCITSIARMHGPSTLVTGLAITTMRDALYLSAYFYVYEGVKGSLLNTTIIRPELAVPLAGGCSGSMAWLAGYPLDCVRARVQGQDLAATHRHARKTGLQIFRELLQSAGGIRALYRGVSPTIARAFIVSSTRFSAYEATLWLFRQQQ